MKKTFLFAFIAVWTVGSTIMPLSMCGQTAKTFTVNITTDGTSNMQVFIPENLSGRAIVDCPGGGYTHLSMQSEGTDWAEYFNAQGIIYGVLKYRMPGGDRTLPMSDAQNAIIMMRDSAEAWGVNPYDVGIMGFSAGGHLASTTATHAPIEARPNFQILFYPVISMEEKISHKGSVVGFLGDNRSDEKLVKAFSNDKQVWRHTTPPAFILYAGDDLAVPPLTNGLPYYIALRKAGVPAELHVYPDGGHGFGFKSTFKYHDAMLSALSTWLDALPAPKATAKRVACIGNSITDGFGIDLSDVNGYPAQLQNILGDDYYVQNFGVSARTMLSKGNLPYVNENAWKEAKTFNPDIVVIKLGTNDSKPMNWDEHGDEFGTDLQAMIDALQALPAKPVIYLCTPIHCGDYVSSDPQDQIRDSVITAGVIPAIEKVAKKNKLTLIDLNPTIDVTSGELIQRDKIHPTPKGAKIIAQTIAQAISGQ